MLALIGVLLPLLFFSAIYAIFKINFLKNELLWCILYHKSTEYLKFSTFSPFPLAPCTIGDADLNDRAFYDVLPSVRSLGRFSAGWCCYCRLSRARFDTALSCSCSWANKWRHHTTLRSLGDDDDDSARTWSVRGLALRALGPSTSRRSHTCWGGAAV